MNALLPAARPSQAPASPRTPYGAAELRGLHDAHLRRAFAAASLLAVGLIGGGRWLSGALAQPVASDPPILVVDRWIEPTLTAPSDASAARPRPAPSDAVRAVPEPVPAAAVRPTPDAPSTLAENASPLPGLASDDGDAGGGGAPDGSGTVPPIEPPADLPADPPVTPDPLPEVVPPVTPPEPVVFGYVEVMPTVVTRPAPEYPEIARQAGIEGRVTVRVRIGREGRVREASVVQSQNPVFDEAALAAVRRWTFTPGIQAGRPVEVWMTIPIRFRQSPR